MGIDDGRFAVLASGFLVSISINPWCKKRLGEPASISGILKNVQNTGDPVVALNLLHTVLNVSTYPPAQVVQRSRWCLSAC
jgi:hypothetical protein